MNGRYNVSLNLIEDVLEAQKIVFEYQVIF